MAKTVIRHTDGEVEARRERVVQLRLMRMTLRQMAGTLGVSEAQVSRDLKAMRTELKRRYDPEDFDPAVAVGEAIQNFEFCEARALREYLTLDRAHETGAEHIHKALQEALPSLVGTARAGIVEAVKERLETLATQVANIARSDKGKQRSHVYAKLRCLQQMREAARERMDLLQDFGLVARVEAKGTGADDRRDARLTKAWLDTIEVNDETLRSAAERAWLAESAPAGSVQ